MIKMIRVNGMARPRSDFFFLWNSSKDSIVEHITKLVVYKEDRPLDLSGWKRTLNKYIPRLNRYNVSARGVHATENFLYADLACDFTLGFTQMFCDEAEELGYPQHTVTREEIKDMLVILNRFCHQVLVTNGRLN